MAVLDVVYVALIEAVKFYIPVEAKKMGENLFLIEKNSQFDPEDNSSFFQFLPGDTVFCRMQTRENVTGNKQQILVADSLASSVYPDRDLFALKFLIVDKEGELTNDQISYFQHYINELRRNIVDNGNSKENPFHPAILRWFDRFSSI